MANYCSNTLIVKGSDTKRFLMQSQGKVVAYPDGNSQKETKFSFNGLVPVPESVIAVGFNKAHTIPFYDGETLPEYHQRTKDILDGYEWQGIHWGTNADADYVQISVLDEGETVVLFETRWKPPTEWFKTVCTFFPNLDMELHYVEENEGDAGKLMNVNGEMKEETFNKFDDAHAYHRFVSGL